jgi:hypothetical protein
VLPGVLAAIIATFPMPLNQHPTTINYSEGIFIGYRGYEKNHIQPLFPFGFGLSYTSFSFSNLKIEPAVFNGHAPITVTFTVTNTGKRAGAEVVELYVGQQNPTIVRPIKELKGFEKVNLNPGQSTKITLRLDQRPFAYFNTTKEKWDAVPGVCCRREFIGQYALERRSDSEIRGDSKPINRLSFDALSLSHGSASIAPG